MMPFNRILNILLLDILIWLNRGINKLYVYMSNYLDYYDCI